MDTEVINIEDITNGMIVQGEWEGTGVFDKLINSVSSNLAIQLESGRLTNAEYGTVYSNIVSTILNVSVDFVLKKRSVELQAEGIIKDNELKQKQIELEYISIIIKDKEAVKLGMDKAFADNNANLKDIYTPIYKEVI